MIGSETCKKHIRQLLKEIAHNNKEKYGHILKYANIPSTRVFVGYVQEEGEDRKTGVYLDIIYGFIEGGSGDPIDIVKEDFFELHEDFEKKMKKKIDMMEEEFSKATKEEYETVRRLEDLLK